MFPYVAEQERTIIIKHAYTFKRAFPYKWNSARASGTWSQPFPVHAILSDS